MKGRAISDAPNDLGSRFCRLHCYRAGVSRGAQGNRGTEFSICLNRKKLTEEGKGKDFDFTKVYAFFRNDLIFAKVILNSFSAIMC